MSKKIIFFLVLVISILFIALISFAFLSSKPAQQPTTSKIFPNFSVNSVQLNGYSVNNTIAPAKEIHPALYLENGELVNNLDIYCKTNPLDIPCLEKNSVVKNTFNLMVNKDKNVVISVGSVEFNNTEAAQKAVKTQVDNLRKKYPQGLSCNMSDGLLIDQNKMKVVSVYVNSGGKNGREDSFALMDDFKKTFNMEYVYRCDTFK